MIYILFDTALNGPYTLMLLQKAYPDNQSLFNGTKDEALSDVAPYLFRVDENLFANTDDQVASLEAIVVIETEEKLPVLLVRLQQFIYHKINGKENYFRFWDARVLQRFLPAANDKKLDQFFDKVKCFYVLDKEKAIAKRFFLKRGKLHTEESALNKLFVLPQTTEQETGNDNSVLTETDTGKKTKRKFF